MIIILRADSLRVLKVCQAARSAHDDGDLSRACWLYLYIIECSESCDLTDVATDYSSQLAEMLLNIYCGTETNGLNAIANISEFLVSAIDLVCNGMTKVFFNFSFEFL